MFIYVDVNIMKIPAKELDTFNDSGEVYNYFLLNFRFIRHTNCDTRAFVNITLV